MKGVFTKPVVVVLLAALLAIPLVGPVPAILLAALLLVPVLVGVYVYHDTKRRGMNTVLWTLVAALAPSLIGFIVYLLVRGGYPDLECSKCGAAVKGEFTVCPSCGTKLRLACPSCYIPVEPDWKVCPKCAAPLPEYQDDIAAPRHRRDQALGKILAVVIIVPLLFLILMGLFVFLNLRINTGSSSLKTYPVDDYLSAMENPEIEDWMETLGDDYRKAYVLKHESKDGSELRVHYLIYLPMLSERHSLSFGASGGLFGNTLKIEFKNADNNGGNTLVFATYRGESEPRLKVYINNRLVELEILEVDYPLRPAANSELEGGESSIEAGVPGGTLTITRE